MKKLPARILAWLCLAALIIGGCSGQSPTQLRQALTIPDVIRLGAIAELSGVYAPLGASFQNAAQLAVRQVNQAGGLQVGGRQYRVELAIQDNASQEERSAAAAWRLSDQEEVVAIIGPNEDALAIAAAQLAEHKGIVLISPGAGDPRLTLDAATGKPRQYIFRVRPVVPYQGQVMAQFVLEDLGANRAAVLYDAASDSSRGPAEAFRQYFEAHGGDMAAFETYITGDKNFTAPLQAILQADPQALFLPNPPDVATLQIQQARLFGLSATILGSDAWQGEEWLYTCGAACEGSYASAHFSAEASQASAEFTTAYTRRYGAPPDETAALTYDAFGLLFQALQSAGLIDRIAVREALAQIANYHGVSGVIVYPPGSGDPRKSIPILQVQHGAFAWFTTLNP